MPLKTNIGVSRKVADNNYGSRGASVNLEVELDSTLINEPKLFHERIRQVFRLAQQAIDDELNRQHGPASHASNGSNGHAAQPSNNGSNGNGHTATNGNASTPMAMAAATARPAISRRKSNSTSPSNWPKASRASASAAWKRSLRRCVGSRWRP